MKKFLLSLLLSATLFAGEYILAINWYPSVCKTQNYRACKKMLPFWKTNFTLHGLWPKGKHYCNVSPRNKILDKKGYWQEIKVDISPVLAELLIEYMPGYVSGLHKHEWVKHGSCYSKKPDIYFLDAISLVSQLNQSPIKQFFLQNRGKRVATWKIRKEFDKAFFKGAGKRVKFICKKGYLTEMRINLKGKIAPKTPLAALLEKAKNTARGCKRGMIAR
ncbi:ribonuclease T2 family protein [Nitratiruptor tergarcus]|uniref:Ribonuclease T2 n=1 Tax=Nitratiruptor tergarcus DSM 16512 TaxID=1069081 RepID=A0A1W1WRL2_9BACT|nr:hypothetical protein [Nitratiruptor tergarcus]SMC08353.1 ribonuclease T2 [Nitratiruptor tergarcus DSM 16512]